MFVSYVKMWFCNKDLAMKYVRAVFKNIRFGDFILSGSKEGSFDNNPMSSDKVKSNWVIAFIMAICFLISPVTLFASNTEVCIEKSGSVNCGSGRVDNVQANGTAVLSGTEVVNHTQVNGILEAKNVKLNSITVNGTAKLKNVQVSSDVIINGILVADDSSFLSTVQLASSGSILKKCSTLDIIIKKVRALKPQLRLSQSHVNGTITFEGGDGEVILCKKSTVSGKIIGGKIVSKC